jgi:alkylhydroperoxidase family enzyme
VLRKNGFSIEQLRAITTDYRKAGLEPAEVAMMEYAQKMALRANEVTEEDVTRLRAHGFTDPEILDIAMAAAARCFFSKTLDGVGAEPDEAYAELAEALADVLPARRPPGSATGSH